jgi:hypothetical protein
MSTVSQTPIRFNPHQPRKAGATAVFLSKFHRHHRIIAGVRENSQGFPRGVSANLTLHRQVLGVRGK